MERGSRWDKNRRNKTHGTKLEVETVVLRTEMENEIKEALSREEL
ncbi:unnamed protein product [Gulo gulo]|uniref:Uncharacterized protein n=1 Tax=Gulo gulo TaxID=48420 RepID=A0A9X9M484_GULGU|nr:unnamed protein product [Gulo gulo]